jgi:hypothetical protein
MLFIFSEEIALILFLLISRPKYYIFYDCLVVIVLLGWKQLYSYRHVFSLQDIL